MAYEKYIEEVIVKDWTEDFKITNFQPYAMNNQVQVIYKFPNGYGASLIHGLGSYGIELAVLYDGELTYNTPITDDVVGNIKSQEQFDDLLKQIYEL